MSANVDRVDPRDWNGYHLNSNTKDSTWAWRNCIKESMGMGINVPTGRTLIEGTVEMSSTTEANVSCFGSGPKSSVFKCRGEGRVSLGPYTPDGNLADNPNPVGGTFQNFGLEGDGTVDRQLFFGLTGGGHVSNIWSSDAGARNCCFYGTADLKLYNLRIMRWKGIGVEFDYGAGGIKFFGGVTQNSKVSEGQYHVRIGSNDTDSTGAIKRSGPSRISWHGHRFDGAAETQDALFLIESGRGLKLLDCESNFTNRLNRDVSLYKIIEPQGDRSDPDFPEGKNKTKPAKSITISLGLSRTKFQRDKNKKPIASNTKLVDHQGVGDPIKFIYQEFENIETNGIPETEAKFASV